MLFIKYNGNQFQKQEFLANISAYNQIVLLHFFLFFCYLKTNLCK